MVERFVFGGLLDRLYIVGFTVCLFRGISRRIEAGLFTVLKIVELFSIC